MILTLRVVWSTDSQLVIFLTHFGNGCVGLCVCWGNSLGRDPFGDRVLEGLKRLLAVLGDVHLVSLHVWSQYRRESKKTTCKLSKETHAFPTLTTFPRLMFHSRQRPKKQQGKFSSLNQGQGPIRESRPRSTKDRPLYNPSLGWLWDDWQSTTKHGWKNAPKCVEGKKL